MPTCPVCGRENRETYSYCEHCGSKVAASEWEEDQRRQERSQDRGRREDSRRQEQSNRDESSRQPQEDTQGGEGNRRDRRRRKNSTQATERGEKSGSQGKEGRRKPPQSETRQESSHGQSHQDGQGERKSQARNQRGGTPPRRDQGGDRNATSRRNLLIGGGVLGLAAVGGGGFFLLGGSGGGATGPVGKAKSFARGLWRGNLDSARKKIHPESDWSQEDKELSWLRQNRGPVAVYEDVSFEIKEGEIVSGSVSSGQVVVEVDTKVIKQMSGFSSNWGSESYVELREHEGVWKVWEMPLRP